MESKQYVIDVSYCIRSDNDKYELTARSYLGFYLVSFPFHFIHGKNFIAVSRFFFKYIPTFLINNVTFHHLHVEKGSRDIALPKKSFFLDF